MIIKNGKTISSVMKGSQVIDKIFKGTLVVYEAWKELIKSGVPPLTLVKCKGVDLLNYKIYGNSVQNGTPTPQAPIEVVSVGNKSKNLFNPNFDTRFTLQEDGSYLSNIQINRLVNIHDVGDLKGIYTISVKVKSPVGTNYRIRVFYADGTNTDSYQLSTGEYVDISLTTENKTIEEIVWYYTELSNEVQFKDFQLEEGTTATNYEPYGYKIPVKVSNGTEEITTNIYLDEQLTINDYIDYKNQVLSKNGVIANIELPNIPTIKGTTIIEVDTETQPSNMEATYIGKN